jgi:hypothetical protein
MNAKLFAVLYFVALGALLASPPGPPRPPRLPAWSPAWSLGVSSSRPPLLAPWRVRLAARPFAPLRGANPPGNGRQARGRGLWVTLCPFGGARFLKREFPLPTYAVAFREPARNAGAYNRPG